MTEKPKQTKKKQTQKRKPGRKKKAIPLNKKINNLIKDERFKFVLSVFILFFAAYLTLAFISYIFTWKVDQSNMGQNDAWYVHSNVIADNWAGNIGAVLANSLIYKWFGVSSFAFIFILVLLSFKLINIKLLHFENSVKYSLFGMIWFSIALSFLSSSNYLILGGAYGYYVNYWLNAIVGKTGTVFLLIILLFGFIIFTFENSLYWVKIFVKNITERKKIKPAIDAANSKVAIKKQDENDELEKIKEEDIIIETGMPIDLDTNAPLEKVDKKEYKLHDNGEEVLKPDLGFEVENTKDVHVASEKLEEKLSGNLALEVEKNKDILVDNQEVQLEDYDPTLDLSNYKFPPIDLLENHSTGSSEVTNEELISNKNKIVDTLKNYKIEITKIKATIGPTITLYEIIPAPGVRISKIKNLEDDIALSLAALGIRIIAPMPGRGTIGIEVPNQKPEIVSMHSVIKSASFQNSKMEIPIAIGKTISNESYVADLTKMPHLLVAGATGQGKSVGLNAILASILYKKHPAQVKLVLVDPKKVELTLYETIEKHYLAKLPDAEEAIITENQKVVHTLASLNIEMDNRYSLLKDAHVRNIKEYNKKFISRKLNPTKGHKYLPYIVLVIDEFADLIMTAGKEVELPIARLAQLARAIGIHLIVATQRPSTNIITGVIKANFPTRIAFKVASMIDSRTILDSPGANQLIGRGDMLITQGSDLIRLQCAFIDTPELDKITKFIGEQQSYPSALLLPDYETGDSDDPTAVDLSKRDELFEDAARLIVVHQQGSTSMIQRKLSIGYNRAGRIIDQLEAAGIVGPFEGSKARQVLYTDEYSIEQYLNSLQ